MSDVMEYKGYIGSVRYSTEDHVLHGKLEGIRDLVTYEAVDIDGLKQSFQDSVDEYLRSCKTHGRQPDKAFKGTFNVRVGPDLHKTLAMTARRQEKKVNALVVEALEYYLAAVGDEERQLAASRSEPRRQRAQQGKASSRVNRKAS